MASDTEMDKEPKKPQIADLILKIKNKKFGEASIDISKLISIYPSSSILYSLKGTIELSEGKYDNAINYFSQAKKNNPDRKEVYFDLGTAYEMKLEYDAAIENFSTVLDLDNEHLASHNSLANVYLKIGDSENALLSLQKAIKLDPNSTAVLNNLGNISKTQGDFETAIKYYKEALDLEPNFTNAKKNMASCYLALKEYKTAGQIYSEIDDKFSISKHLECLLNLGQNEKLFSFIKSIREKDPHNLWIAAISAYASHQSSVPDEYPFCPNPLDYIHLSNLRTHINNYEAYIKSLLYEMDNLNSEWEPKNKTTKKGFQTANDLFLKKSENLDTLKAIIVSEIQAYRYRFKQSNNLLIKNFPDRVKLNGWYVKLVKQGHQDSHIHPTGWVSGVIYLKTVQNAKNQEGAIQFGLHGYNYPKPLKEEKKLTWLPNDGDLVLFPSSQFHNTVPVEQDCERCVIAFDLVPN